MLTTVSLFPLPGTRAHERACGGRGDKGRRKGDGRWEMAGGGGREGERVVSVQCMRSSVRVWEGREGREEREGGGRRRRWDGKRSREGKGRDKEGGEESGDLFPGDFGG